MRGRRTRQVTLRFPAPFTTKRDLLLNVITETSTTRRRGRPPGRTTEGEATGRRLFETAIGLIADRGYEAATLRDVAAKAGVSPALLYRYFPNKRAVVLALYDALSEAFARELEAMPRAKWRERYVFALELSLRVLGPHRLTLRALAPVMVGSVEDGVFARNTMLSRDRVIGAFQLAVTDATDRPEGPLAESLGRLLYLAHLCVILWWLLDRTPNQRATRALVALIAQILPSATLALKLRPVKGFVQSADALFREALL
jgi:AcrR family transcriptional regulator